MLQPGAASAVGLSIFSTGSAMTVASSGTSHTVHQRGNLNQDVGLVAAACTVCPNSAVQMASSWDRMPEWTAWRCPAWLAASRLTTGWPGRYADRSGETCGIALRRGDGVVKVDAKRRENGCSSRLPMISWLFSVPSHIQSALTALSARTPP
jgi:hypothetical protein